MRIPNLNPFNRKSPLERLLGSLDESLGAAADLPSSLPRSISSNKTRAGLIAAGGVAGLTAASSGISALRRRLVGPQGNS
jgi:hypothetical protein